MPVTASEEIALQAALSTLLSSTQSGGALARQARALSRAADDAEVAAVECPDAPTRHALMEQVNAARGAAAEARRKARATALVARREELLNGGTADETPKNLEGAAASLAKEINDGLRRATAIVSDEVGRSQAAGKVVDESSRRLRMTRDQHSQYGETLSSGAETLTDIRRTELVANVAVVISFVVFFLVAAYVAHRRVTTSNTATFLVKPAAKIVFAPVRILAKIVAIVLKKPVVEPRAGPVDTRGSEADVKGKARKGRENVSSVESHRAKASDDEPLESQGHVEGESGKGSSDNPRDTKKQTKSETHSEPQAHLDEAPSSDFANEDFLPGEAALEKVLERDDLKSETSVLTEATRESEEDMLDTVSKVPDTKKPSCESDTFEEGLGEECEGKEPPLDSIEEEGAMEAGITAGGMEVKPSESHVDKKAIVPDGEHSESRDETQTEFHTETRPQQDTEAKVEL